MKEETSNIKNKVLNLNLKLKNHGLIIQNFGNASIKVNDKFYIKPSGVNLENTLSEDIVEVNIYQKNKFENFKPSVDYPTHKVIYENFPEINSIIHTHSIYATAFAQAELPIENLGTTQSDFANGAIPISRKLSEEEIHKDYEKNTGKSIVEMLKKDHESCFDIPGVLAFRHGVFSWGKNEDESYKNAEIIEFLAKLNFITKSLNSRISPVDINIQKKHFNRKKGPDSYYGQ